MSDDGNGTAPATLEQRVHALEDKEDANRRQIGNLEGRWGQTMVGATKAQRDARKAAAAANAAREAVWGLTTRLEKFETVILGKVGELVDLVRQLLEQKAGG